MLAQVDIQKEFFGFGNKFPTTMEEVGPLISRFINIAFIAAGIILLFFFIVGGIGLISGAGGDNPEQLEKGKKAVTSALIGFVVVFAAYWIVQLIQIITGVSIF
jgi:hypothetical protein